jgi:hypothetical protein
MAEFGRPSAAPVGLHARHAAGYGAATPAAAPLRAAPLQHVPSQALHICQARRGCRPSRCRCLRVPSARFGSCSLRLRRRLRRRRISSGSRSRGRPCGCHGGNRVIHQGGLVLGVVVVAPARGEGRRKGQRRGGNRREERNTSVRQTARSPLAPAGPFLLGAFHEHPPAHLLRALCIAPAACSTAPPDPIAFHSFLCYAPLRAKSQPEQSPKPNPHQTKSAPAWLM